MRSTSQNLILILNEPAKDYMGSGNVREYALVQWAKRQGAEVWVVRDQRFASSRSARLLAIPRLLARLWGRPQAIVILGYPGFPFFWSLDSIPQLMRTFLFVAGMKIVGVIRRLVIVVDIMDLPRYQHIDLHYSVGLPKWLYRAFDVTVYHLATQLWVCSAAIAERIKREMLWGRERAKTVENGTFPSDVDGRPGKLGRPSVFIYAGQLAKTRGVPELIDAFCRCKRDDVELRLCGGSGDWIPEYCSDPRVRYIGKFNHEQCNQAVAECDVGMVFQPRGVYYDMVFPTKLPLYVARGKPILGTDNPELARVLSDRKIGLTAPADQLAEVIDGLTEEFLASCGANAAALREASYWDRIYDEAYAGLASAPQCNTGSGRKPTGPSRGARAASCGMRGGGDDR